MWSNIAFFEMRNGFFDRARKVWQRIVEVFPQVDELWRSYIRMEEEMLGNGVGARQIFEDWVTREPGKQIGWLSYVNFELRHKQSRSSSPDLPEFETKYGDIARARTCFEKAVDQVMAMKDNVDEEAAEKLFLAYAEFEEEKCKDVEKARRIYQISLEHFLHKGVKAEKLCSKFVAFEKLCGGGDREGEDAI
ncbi:OLC1v1032861C1 [Oldenlandia corymbosa var. corymbosa]|uniref:OLC1v1032861C1 n=1 Tax=Oldenlandia corymbosa var. corymbosa TaxID=529605 RepID=A0AAV1CNE8_OLDCO|nr:OLC1v1032861C1 [Oldenlandia corymbosa var. corymbosa]